MSKMIQKRKFENLTTLDQVMPFCGHCVQCGVCDHHIPLGQIGFRKGSYGHFNPNTTLAEFKHS